MWFRGCVESTRCRRSSARLSLGTGLTTHGDIIAVPIFRVETARVLQVWMQMRLRGGSSCRSFLRASTASSYLQRCSIRVAAAVLTLCEFRDWQI